MKNKGANKNKKYMKEQMLSEERYGKIFTQEMQAKLYTVGLLVNCAYSLAFDIEKALDKKGLHLKHDAKMWFTRLKKNLQEQERLLQTIAEHYAEHMEDEVQDIYLHLSDIWECYIKNMADKLASAGDYVENYEKIWNNMETCETMNIIQYDVPNFKMIETREEFKEKE